MPEQKKVLVNQIIWEDSIHAVEGCTGCHGGDDSTVHALNLDRESAHSGNFLGDPTRAETVSQGCGECHADIVAKYNSSIHQTKAGIKWAVGQRTGNLEAIKEPMEKNCLTPCHTSCGQCHISRPTDIVGSGRPGGFIDYSIRGHYFWKRPPMESSCGILCHGGRVWPEYSGKEFPADVHYLKGMHCVDCHPQEEMHNSVNKYGKTPRFRYEVDNGPRCERCHNGVVAPWKANSQGHLAHADYKNHSKTALQCHVCHSDFFYNNCFGCHVRKDIAGRYMSSYDQKKRYFKIGRNYLKSPDRPYDYIVVRHNPVTRDIFFHVEEKEESLLSNFDALPTWSYASPHNVRRKTPQNKNCIDTCHGNAMLYLLKGSDDIPEGEEKANEAVALDSVPGADLAGNLNLDKIILIIDFGNPYGIWVYYNGSTWSKLHSLSPEIITVGDIDGTGQDDLIIDFGNPYGIWVYYNGSTWSKLHSLSPCSIWIFK